MGMSWFPATLCAEVPPRDDEALWENYGDGWAGTAGVPSLTASAAPVLCTEIDIQIGNSSPDAAAACVLVGASPANLPSPVGGTFLVTSVVEVPIVVPPGGTTAAFAVPCDVAVLGMEHYLQSFMIDPGASDGVAFSRGLRLVPGFMSCSGG